MSSRRDFIKNAITLSSALAFPPSLLSAQEPAPVLGFYVPAWFGVTRNAIDGRVALLKEVGFNALMVDVKNAHGEVFYEPTSSLVQRIDSQVRTKDGNKRYLEMDYLRRKADEQGIRLIARHVMFRDEHLFEKSPDSRLFSHRSERWVDPRLDQVLDYNLALLEQEKEMGFDEIVLDYIRFPATEKFGKQKEKNLVISNVVAQAKAVVSGIDLSAQVFGYVSWGYAHAGVGQDLNLLKENLDIVYPMLYPSHFNKPSFGYTDPEAHVCDFIKMGCIAAQGKMSQVMPMVQAYAYSPKKVKDQFRAASDLQLPGAIAWNPTGRYVALQKAFSVKYSSSELSDKTL